MQESLMEFVERFGLDFERYGSSRTLGRLFARLLVSDTPQSLDDLAQGLLVSKATVSLTVRQAWLAGLVQKVSRRGDRRDYYEVPPDVWTRSTLVQLQILTRWKAFAHEGLAAVPEGSPSGQRLERMLQFFQYLDDKMSAVAAELDVLFGEVKRDAIRRDPGRSSD